MRCADWKATTMAEKLSWDDFARLALERIEQRDFKPEAYPPGYAAAIRRLIDERGARDTLRAQLQQQVHDMIWIEDDG